MNPGYRAAKAAWLLIISAVAAAPAVADIGPGDPKPDINIVGPTRDPADIRDEGLKQQNEPACAIRPGDGDCIVCFFNDYRTVDIIGHEDAWIGQAESCDAGNTWTSRIVPGHPFDQDSPPIGTKFAADPRVIALPGMALHGFIGGFRNLDSGVIALQHWLENNKDDYDYYEPALNTIIVDEGTEGRFIDKPDFLAVLDDPGSQGIVTLSHEMENPELGTIVRDYPSGKLYAAYAVFTGSQSVKLLVKTSDDWGKTWRNKTTKLTESQNLVTGITMTSMGNIVIAMWRQVLDTNDVDAIYYATTTNGGRNWSKPTLLTDICKFDQPSATDETFVSFRTNDFPWLANDGKNLFAFYTQRAGNCATGVPKIVMQHSGDGSTWSSPQQVSPGSIGAEFMPAAFGARGKVQVAWYDTRREEIPYSDSVPLVADYFNPDVQGFVNRKVDVYTARVSTDASGNNVEISDAVRVNRYRTVTSGVDPDSGITPVIPAEPEKEVYEVEASFANAMMYKSGLLAFLGDYFAVTAPEFRLTDGGDWEANYSAVPNESNLVDFFIAYADHRDVRGDILFGDGGQTKPYTPPVNVPATSNNEAPQTDPPEPLDEDRVLVASADANEHRKSAEGVEDAYTDPVANACEWAPEPASRTRDANIYGAVIRDRLRISSPVESRPLSGILRAIPFAVNNVTDTEVSYRLYIANQPGADPEWHRASFRQQPDRPPFNVDNYPDYSEDPNAPNSIAPVLIEDVTIEPNSSIARTVFVVSTDLNATVEVQVLEAGCEVDCEVLGSITVGGTNRAGSIQQPTYQSLACLNDPDCNDNVLVSELHNPLIENPLIENPLIENPLIENPLIENPLIENPLIENPLIENLGFENPLIENPLIENPLIENPLIENPLIENPLIENPLIENSAIEAGITFTDKTAVIRNDGNVTTAYNVDATVSGFSTTAGGDTVSQLIIWKQYVYATARGCEYRAEARDQVITTINQPDNELSLASIEEPFKGAASIILAPGEQGFVTYRLWGTKEELANTSISGFTASSQAANCSEKRNNDDEPGPPPGLEDDFYTCEQQIATGRERILLEIDTTAPTFDNVTTDPIPVPAEEANLPGGACFSNPVTELDITATDESGSDVAISCSTENVPDICSFVNDPFGVSVPVSNLSAFTEPQPTPMICYATDEAGNTASAVFLVQVYDTTPPMFESRRVLDGGTETIPAGELSGTASKVLEDGFTAKDVDDVDLNPVVECSATTEAGDVLTNIGAPVTLPAGDNAVTCKAIDASGYFSETSYTLRVEDVTAPVITLNPPAIQTIEVGDPYDELGATASDVVDGLVDVTIDASDVDTSTIGSYTVIYTAQDGSGNTSTKERAVNVVDNTAPVLTVPSSPVFVAIQGSTGATITLEDYVTVTDVGDPDPELICSPASGTEFPAGETNVTCYARDASNNVSPEKSFDIVVGYIGYGIIPKRNNTKAGNSNPLTWAWRDANGQNVDTSDQMQTLTIFTCTSPDNLGNIVLFANGDPGSSGFRFKSDYKWEYNWQSDYGDGRPLDPGTYCATVTTASTKDSQFLVSPVITVR